MGCFHREERSDGLTVPALAWQAAWHHIPLLYPPGEGPVLTQILESRAGHRGKAGSGCPLILGNPSSLPASQSYDIVVCFGKKNETGIVKEDYIQASMWYLFGAILRNVFKNAGFTDDVVSSGQGCCFCCVYHPSRRDVRTQRQKHTNFSNYHHDTDYRALVIISFTACVHEHTQTHTHRHTHAG